MKTVILALFLLLTATAAHADPKNFYGEDVAQGWRVYGTVFNEPDKDDACTARSQWADGSFWHLTAILKDNTIRVVMRNTDWQVSGERMATIDVQMNSYLNGKFIAGATSDFYLIDKNTIVSDSLHVEKFTEMIFRGDRMSFIMPGNMPNFHVVFGESAKILASWADCITAGKAILSPSTNHSRG